MATGLDRHAGGDGCLPDRPDLDARPDHLNHTGGHAMTARTARLDRETKESKVVVELDLDGTGRADVSTGVAFYDHMLTSLARHALWDLTVSADGDVHVDAHHTVEDVAI